ncbi:MAG: divalent metal cation transporter, partial [Bacteroidota bacterium]|nr:divalent metal cation transporter [Bacteroidota bacterium]
SLVQSRSIAKTYTGRAEASKYNFLDSAIALNAAFFVNAAILIVAAASFYSKGIVVTEIQKAHSLLAPVLGSTLAPILFAAALLASGQSSTLTGTISGQIVMEGFLNFKMRPWVRRIFTRSVALIPAVIVIAISGNKGTYNLLILSQVILSLQLPFAVIPLVHFTSDKDKMGNFANKPWLKVLAWAIAGTITYLNVWLVYLELVSIVSLVPYWIFVLIFIIIIFLVCVLLYIFLAPFFGIKKKWESGIITRGEIIAKNLSLKTIKNIGAAIENGPGDNDIISMALSIAKPDQAKLTLIHIMESPGALVYGDLSETQHSKQDVAYMEELVREIEKPNLPVEFCLRNGKPVQTIVAIAKEYNFDMLVMGTHGHSGINDIIFGQTVNGVRHALDIPVLTVRVKDTTTTETPIFESKEVKA